MESGNSFFKNDVATKSSTSQKNAGTIAKCLNKMHYTGIGVGNYDFAADYFKSNTSTDHSPFISANVMDNVDTPKLLPYTSITAGSYKIGISSVADMSSGKIALPNTLSWRDALKNQIPRMARQFDFIVILSSLSTQQNREIAAIYPQINLIISADKNIGNLSPSLIATTLITQTSTLGQYLGILDIELAPSLAWKKNYFAIHDLQRSKYTLSKKIRKLRKEKRSDERTAALNKIKKEKADLPEKMKMLREGLMGQNGSSFSVQFVPIPASLAKDPVIEAIIKQ